MGAVALSATIALTGCSSSGGAAGGVHRGVRGRRWASPRRNPSTIAVITHETPGDTFWDKIKAGMNSAAANHGITIKYSNDPTAAGQATLIQNAVDSKVDGIATTLVTPEALAPAVKAATDAGIPVVGFNSGIDAVPGPRRVDVLRLRRGPRRRGRRRADHRGGCQAPALRDPGRGIGRAGDALCRREGESAPGTENIQVNGADLSSVQSTLTAKLQQDPSIDYIVTLGAPIALAALSSMADAGSTAKLATFDLNADAVAKIKDGSIQFSIDQQPYLQGYQAVDSLWLYLTNGNDPRWRQGGSDRTVVRGQHQHRRHRRVRGERHPLIRCGPAGAMVPPAGPTKRSEVNP